MFNHRELRPGFGERRDLWRIFVDLRWVQKQVMRGSILAGIILVLTAVVMVFVIQASSAVGVKPLE